MLGACFKRIRGTSEYKTSNFDAKKKKNLIILVVFVVFIIVVFINFNPAIVVIQVTWKSFQSDVAATTTTVIVFIAFVSLFIRRVCGGVNLTAHSANHASKLS